ncbi:hypothetical protein DBV15_07394 [Temnothorax longispinosus]|uniref:Uncharacterized protein n=1 Tax=Temnothorax longispinosus TaxID=300112 RepID=A0A4S2KZV9_9HYME|nr:hypothetical protein DBV15_07394 [Temnothorax longispinosus]
MLNVRTTMPIMHCIISGLRNDETRYVDSAHHEHIRERRETTEKEDRREMLEKKRDELYACVIREKVARAKETE